jgi:hypothetical protein
MKEEMTESQVTLNGTEGKGGEQHKTETKKREGHCGRQV